MLSMNDAAGKSLFEFHGVSMLDPSLFLLVGISGTLKGYSVIKRFSCRNSAKLSSKS